MKKIIPPILLTLGLTMLVSYTIAGDKNTAEILYGIQLNKEQLEIRVKSTGCTKPEHFKVETKAEADHQQLLIVRTKTDRCRAMPRIITVNLDILLMKKNNL